MRLLLSILSGLVLTWFIISAENISTSNQPFEYSNETYEYSNVTDNFWNTTYLPYNETNTTVVPPTTPEPTTSFIERNETIVLNETLLVFDGNVSDLIQSIVSRDSYNKEVRPYAGEGRSAKVYLDVEVQSISSISEVDMAITATLILRMFWQDPRLSYTEVDSSLTLNYNQYDRLWTPDLYFSNEKGGFFHSLTVPNRLLRLWPDGTMLLSQRLTVTLSCFMFFQNYPLDNQTCPVFFESYGYVKNEVEFLWLDEGSLKLNKDMVLPEFSITGTSLDTCSRISITGEFTCLKGNIYLKREMNYFLVQVYIPSILLVILSWINFWIDAKAAPARVSLGLITVLTITTQSSGISSRLPKVSYVKAIDVWMSTCLVFVFAAFIQYAIVNVALNSHNSKSKSSPSAESAESRKKKRNEDFICNEGKDQWNKNTEPNSADVRLSTLSTTNSEVYLKPDYETPIYTTLWEKLCCDNHVYVGIDNFSKFLFPISFIAFNIVYWAVYLTQ